MLIQGFLDILRKKIQKIDLSISDDLVLLETCAIKGLISYPDFISLNNMLKVKSNLKKFRLMRMLLQRKYRLAAF